MKIYFKHFIIISGLAGLLMTHMAFAKERLHSFDDIDLQINALKKEMIELGRDIKVLEEVLLYPPEERVSIYLSMDIGKLFDLESVKLTINNEVLVNQIYSDREEHGFKQGAAQQLYLGNYAPGKYMLRAIFTGKGPHGRSFKRAVKFVFTKERRPKTLEIVIEDNMREQQPEFVIKEIG